MRTITTSPFLTVLVELLLASLVRAHLITPPPQLRPTASPNHQQKHWPGLLAKRDGNKNCDGVGICTFHSLMQTSRRLGRIRREN